MKSGFSTIRTLLVRLRAGWLLALVCCFQCGCNEKVGPSVYVVVPNGFRGLIRIVADKSGLEIPADGGEFVYRIPAGGILVVHTAVGFGEWHQERATYESGEPLEFLTSEMYPSPPGISALYELGRSSKELRLFLGTHDQMVSFLKSPAGVFR